MSGNTWCSQNPTHTIPPSHCYTNLFPSPPRHSFPSFPSFPSSPPFLPQGEVMDVEMDDTCLGSMVDGCPQLGSEPVNSDTAGGKSQIQSLHFRPHQKSFYFGTLTGRSFNPYLPFARYNYAQVLLQLEGSFFPSHFFLIHFLFLLCHIFRSAFCKTAAPVYCRLLDGVPGLR